MADGTGYGLQNIYTMLVHPNGGRAILPAADSLADRAEGKVNSFFLEALQSIDPSGYKIFVDLFGIENGVATKATLAVSDSGRSVFNP